MGERHFRKMLEARYNVSTMLCVGLDEPDKALALKIVKDTGNIAAAFKINPWTWLACGLEGFSNIRSVVAHIRHFCPGVPVIIDAKFNDVQHSNEHAAQLAFGTWDADAVTVSINPHTNMRVLEPFTKHADKGVFVVCLNSRRPSDSLQSVSVRILGVHGEYEPYYQCLARSVGMKMNGQSNCGLVVGANNTKELASIRSIVGENMPILVPGCGTQGGNVEAVVRAGKNTSGTGLLINFSRSISNAHNPRSEAYKHHKEILNAR
jgi:orotidine-5'-phosphate decarboxylase